MMTRRDLFVALTAVAVAGEKVASAEQANAGPAVAAPASAIMGSTVFDWNALSDTPNEVGSVRTLCKSPTATLQQLEMHITTLDPGKSPHPPHRHPNEELIIVRQGTVETLSNGEWKRVGAGSVIFNASNQLHGLKNVGTEKAVYHVINVKTAATPESAG
jgi:quercetin dioxygenase-like cupin family protein